MTLSLGVDAGVFVVFAVILGALVLTGTSTNIIASRITGRSGRELGDPRLHPFGMFEVTALGIVVVTVGSAYLRV